MQANVLSSQKYNESHLKVASLNFSGINISPFEYHDGSEEKNTLNQIFRSLLDTFNIQNPNTTWNIAKIDKVFQKERYTILYQPDCGCVRGKLLTKLQFQIVWDRTFDQNQGIVSHMNLTEEDINRLRSFDYLAYQAYLQSLFGKVDMNHLQKYSASKYTEDLKKWHQKSYLNSATKIEYVKKYIEKQNLDVLFLQQALVGRAKDYLPNNQYSFVKNSQSMIVFKKESYFMQDHEDQTDFHEKYKDILNFNKDSCFFKSKEILLLSVHLSAKKTAHVDQAKQMIEVLQQISREHKDLKIIVGIDANHPLNQSSFHTVPQKNTATTRKKRTNLQCQFQKADQLVAQSKDFVITNVPITTSHTSMICGKDVNDDLLPNDQHPFDHFIISAHLFFDKVKVRERAEMFLHNFASPIRLLIEGSKKKCKNRSFEQIVDQLIAHIVPPEAGEPFRGFKKALPQNIIPHHRKSIGSKPVSPIDFKHHDFIKWDNLKNLNKTKN